MIPVEMIQVRAGDANYDIREIQSTTCWLNILVMHVSIRHSAFIIAPLETLFDQPPDVTRLVLPSRNTLP